MPPRPLVRAAFDRGQVPTVACFNRAATMLGLDLDKLLAVLQKFVDTRVATVWGTPAKLVESTGFLPEAWAIVFLDTADAPGALAYHDLTPDGFPLSKVFVKTILDDKASLSVATSHELVEMLVDPAINLWATGQEQGVFFAYEAADPVEEESFPFDGFAMTDFVYPSYFESFRKPDSTQFDATKKVSRPFQILKGGYQIVFKNGQETQVFGSADKAERFAKEDRRGHRSEYRHIHSAACNSEADPGKQVRILVR
jgi:hypothetical protein